MRKYLKDNKLFSCILLSTILYLSFGVSSTKAEVCLANSYCHGGGETNNPGYCAEQALKTDPLDCRTKDDARYNYCPSGSGLQRCSLIELTDTLNPLPNSDGSCSVTFQENKCGRVEGLSCQTDLDCQCQAGCQWFVCEQNRCVKKTEQVAVPNGCLTDVSKNKVVHCTPGSEGHAYCNSLAGCQLGKEAFFCYEESPSNIYCQPGSAPPTTISPSPSPTLSLSCFVFIDDDQNGQFNIRRDKVAPSGITVKLSNDQTAQTESLGTCKFPNIKQGAYTMEVITPRGFKNTTQNPRTNIQVGPQSRTVYFGIAPINAPTAKPTVKPFSVGSVTPNPVKPGGKVTINLSSTQNGVYSYQVEDVDTRFNNFRCTGSTCKLELTMPQVLQQRRYTVLIRDPNGSNQRTVIVTVNPLPTPTPRPATPPPSEPTEEPVTQLPNTGIGASTCYTCDLGSEFKRFYRARNDKGDSSARCCKYPRCEDDELDSQGFPGAPATLDAQLRSTAECIDGIGWLDCKDENGKRVCEIPAPSTAGLPCKAEELDADGNCIIQTAVGGIFTSPNELVRWMFGLLLSISGGIAVLLIMRSGYTMMTSQGNPESIKSAREQITSVIIGLLFMILSIVILQIIAVDILSIPGLSGT